MSDCPTCGEAHVQLVPGTRYRIDAEDCCLSVLELEGTFIGWVPSIDGSIVCDRMQFAEGFSLGYGWFFTADQFTELPRG